MPELAISTDKVGFLIEKAREYDVKEGATDLDSGSNGADDNMIDVLQDNGSDPVAQEIAGFIAAMTEEEQIDLVALMRLGRGDGTHRGVGRSAPRGGRRPQRPHRALSARRAAAQRLSRRRPRRVRPVLDRRTDHAGGVTLSRQPIDRSVAGNICREADIPPLWVVIMPSAIGRGL